MWFPGNTFMLTYTPFAHNIGFERVFPQTESVDEEKCTELSCIALWGTRFPTCIHGTCINTCPWREVPLMRFEKDVVNRSVAARAGLGSHTESLHFSTLKAGFQACANRNGCAGISARWDDDEIVSVELGAGNLVPSTTHLAYLRAPNCSMENLPGFQFNISKPRASSLNTATATGIIEEFITNGTFPYLTSIEDIPDLTVEQQNEIMSAVGGILGQQ